MEGLEARQLLSTYYVATNGSSGNSGLDAAHPWDFATVQSNSAPGNTYMFANGTYTGGNNGGQIKLDNKAGSDTNRIVWQSSNKWGAVLQPNTPYQGLAMINCSGVTIDGFAFDGTNVANYGISAFSGCNYVTVRNCKVYNAGQGGIGVASDNALIENNVVFNNSKRSPSDAQGSGISVYEPLAVDSHTTNGFGIIIRNNIVYDNALPTTYTQTDGNGIILDDWRHTQNTPNTNYTKGGLVENNICYNNGGRGVHVFQTDNATVRNNTAWHNNTLLHSYTYKPGEISLQETSGSSVYNNIMVAPANDNSSALTLLTSDVEPVQNNIVVGRFVGSTGNVTTMSTAQSYNNQQMDGASQQTYPQFINPSTDATAANFHTQTTSPAVDAGKNANAAAKDFDGVSRPVGATVDIGAYETTTQGSGSAKLTGTQISNTPVDEGTAANVFDGNFSTYGEHWSNGGWFGLDLGSAQNITSIKFAPRSGDPVLQQRMIGGMFQASNTADFSSGVVQLGATITTAPPANQLTTYSVTGNGYRYVRYINQTGLSTIAALEFWGRSASPAKLTGTQISRAPVDEGTAANVFDGNFSTYGEHWSNGGWFGLDLGSAQNITSIKFASRSGDPVLQQRMIGGMFQASNTADFSSGVVQLGATITTAPPANQLTTYTVTGSGYRYVRYINATGLSTIAELEFWGTSALQSAGGTPTKVQQPLSTTAIATEATEAISRWALAGANVSALKNVKIVVTDLGGNLLGTYGSNVLMLDDDAAGMGWYIDSNLKTDIDFSKASMAPAGMDLLTVLMHEYGHALGLGHSPVTNEVMGDTLITGVRRNPTVADVFARTPLVEQKPDEWRIFDDLLQTRGNILN